MPYAAPEEQQKTMKVWIRISGQGEEEAIGVKVPTSNKELTIGELKATLLPLVSFDDFPITVEKLRPHHLNIVCNNELLQDNDLVFSRIDDTLVVAPSGEACKPPQDEESHQSTLLELWSHLPTGPDDGSPPTPPDPSRPARVSTPPTPPSPLPSKEVVGNGASTHRSVGGGNRDKSDRCRRSVREFLTKTAVRYETTEELTPVPHVTHFMFNKALEDLRRPEWQVQFAGLTLIRRIAVYHSNLLANSLHAVLLAVTACMKSLRSAVLKNALLTFSDIVKSDCREMKALDGQLDPLTAEVLRLSTGDNHFIREAAEECFHDVIKHVTDPHRLRLISRMLASATGSKNATLRSQCTKVITDAVRSVDKHTLHGYTKLPFLLKSLHSFLSDPSEGCRHAARKLGQELSSAVSGGTEEFVGLLYDYLTPSQVEAVCRGMGTGWHPSPPDRGRQSPCLSPAGSFRGPVRSPSPSRLSAGLSAPRTRSKSPKRQQVPSSPSLSSSYNSLMNHEVPVYAEHSATPSISEIRHQKACDHFRAAWGTPTRCGNCKQNASAHAGAGAGGAASRRTGSKSQGAPSASSAWDATSATSCNSRGSRQSKPGRRQVTQQGSPSAARRPPIGVKSPAQSPSAGRSQQMQQRVRRGSLPEDHDVMSAGELDGFEPSSVQQLKEEHQKELAEKDAMIFALLKENMKLKNDLEEARATIKEREKREVDHVTILTTADFGDSATTFVDSCRKQELGQEGADGGDADGAAGGGRDREAAAVSS